MEHLFGDVEPLINCNPWKMYELTNLKNVKKKIAGKLNQLMFRNALMLINVP